MTENVDWETKEMLSTDKAWKERTGPEKALFVAIQVFKAALVLGLLYIFIISLGVMGNAFTIIGGPTAGRTFRANSIFSNPFAGCSLGILATVLVQSSSTTTSIIITMTAAGLMTPENAMYMIMGANIGTSVTNTIVSMSQVGDRDEYRRAFAGATVHDCFNLLTVSILLPVEYFTHMLYHIGNSIVTAAGIEEDQDKASKVDFIKVITKPISSRIVSVDKKLVTKVAQEEDSEKLDKLLKSSIIVNGRTKSNHMFMDTPLSDSAAGWLLLFLSIVLLSSTLILLVKLLQTIFRGRAAIWMKGLLNLEFQTMPVLADYVLIMFGVGITILMQSSSVTTSTLTPLVGIGLIKLDKMFPFTVGANIGTTVTGMLSALAGSNVATGMTVALGHLFFNLIGTAIWFPIPSVRAVPLNMAKALGSIAADLRWFPLAYILFVFAVLPGALLGLSLLHWAALVFVGLPILLLLLATCCVFSFRTSRPHVLPEALKKDYDWMSPSMRINSAPSAAMDSAAAAGPKSTDMESSHRWWLAPVAYGLGWYVLLALLLAIPNAQWAVLKYATFDQRGHIGLGSWSACSSLFGEDVGWAAEPLSGDAMAQYLDDCTADLQGSCSGSNDTFSTTPGANELYQESWEGCKLVRTVDWEKRCLSLVSCGEDNEKQCNNVSEAVMRSYVMDYNVTGPKWSKTVKDGRDNYCIPIESLCEDVGGFGTAGDLAVAATSLGFLAQLSLLAYSLMGEDRDMSKFLWLSGTAFVVMWALLLASWLTVDALFGQPTTCYIQDDQNDGIVAATGLLKDIVNPGGSYVYYYVIGSWVTLVPIIIVVFFRIYEDYKAGSSCPPAAATPAEKRADSRTRDEEQSPVEAEAPVAPISESEVQLQVEEETYSAQEPAAASGSAKLPEQPGTMCFAPSTGIAEVSPAGGDQSPDTKKIEVGHEMERKRVGCLCNTMCAPHKF